MNKTFLAMIVSGSLALGSVGIAGQFNNEFPVATSPIVKVNEPNPNGISLTEKDALELAQKIANSSSAFKNPSLLAENSRLWFRIRC
ncbi:hypothetical protein SAMN04489737_1077 [Arcanobacterium phocae]|uniref:Uncharacterized protein n=1 Tax=Arcanobacterium phocae TaxID=131112 RepID=A0A1H2LGK4_9ACTO|nr:hypothetical protein [Arcanobacterium phocae]SDU80039.1 hypothetical protein SAMN04489737_1077 [Arcanobacterium phocae]